MNKSDLFYVHALNLISWIGHHSQLLSDEGDHAFGTIGIRSSDGLFATQSCWRRLNTDHLEVRSLKTALEPKKMAINLTKPEKNAPHKAGHSLNLAGPGRNRTTDTRIFKYPPIDRFR